MIYYFCTNNVIFFDSSDILINKRWSGSIFGIISH